MRPNDAPKAPPLRVDWRVLGVRRTLLLLVLLAGCKKETRPPSLGEPISVEQPGGSVAQLFSQGSEIPTSATESFTTKKDGEKHILIHVLRGAGRTADKLHTDGWWTVDGVNSAKAGEPRILVTFELDAQGHVSLTAREDERRLAIKKVDKGADKLTPSPLTEPDDDEDLEEDQE